MLLEDNLIQDTMNVLEEVPVPEVVPVDVATAESDSPLNVKLVACRRRNCEHTVSYQNNIS